MSFQSSPSRCTFFALHVINPKKDFKQSDEGGGGGPVTVCDLKPEREHPQKMLSLLSFKF